MVGAVAPEASLLKLREHCASFYQHAVLSPLFTFWELYRSAWGTLLQSLHYMNVQFLSEACLRGRRRDALLPSSLPSLQV